MINQIKELVGFNKICGALITSVLLSIVFIGMTHLFEMVVPYSWYWQYLDNTPQPKNYYEVGESIDILSTVNNKKSIDKQRQDTAYCTSENNNIPIKLPTQYRPAVGYEYTMIGSKSNTWTYGVLIPIRMTQCMICGVIVGVTNKGYKKYDSYCTKWFGVNGNKNQHELELL